MTGALKRKILIGVAVLAKLREHLAAEVDHVPPRRASHR
jgi:hypothetical protein